MHAAGGLEFAVVEGLDAEADSVESGGEPRFRSSVVIVSGSASRVISGISNR